MKELNNFTLKEITDYIIEQIANEKNISKKLSRKLFINAISYNVVIEEIKNQIDFLIDEDSL